jgi:ABC-type antimicrobial peptide transport system permease subunit
MPQARPTGPPARFVGYAANSKSVFLIVLKSPTGEIAGQATGFAVDGNRIVMNEHVAIQERLLANLAIFFAAVALLLAAIGLYGLLNYSVLQREREIGIRVAVGAQAQNIAWLVTTRVSAMVLLGALAGFIVALGSQRYVTTLLYRVKATDPLMLVLPLVVLLTAALLAVLPAIRRAIRIDPSVMLRAE